MDDSHGVGGFGPTGRGTEEYCGAEVDLIIGTLGKAFGVNGGYVVTSREIVDYLRQTAPMYIYSNPITVSEASAASAALELLDSPKGLEILEAPANDDQTLCRQALLTTAMRRLQATTRLFPSWFGIPLEQRSWSSS